MKRVFALVAITIPTAQAMIIAGYGVLLLRVVRCREGGPRSAMSGSDDTEGAPVDMLLDESITFTATVYLGLFALLVFGGIAIYVGYRTFGLMLICSSVATIAALIFRVLP
jgi:hypothetical protein